MFLLLSLTYDVTFIELQRFESTSDDDKIADLGNNIKDWLNRFTDTQKQSASPSPSCSPQV